MISGFSKGALVTGSKEYKNIAVAAAEFVLKHLYVNDEATLLRSCYSGKTGAIEQMYSLFLSCQLNLDEKQKNVALMRTKFFSCISKKNNCRNSAICKNKFSKLSSVFTIR